MDKEGDLKLKEEAEEEVVGKEEEEEEFANVGNLKVHILIKVGNKTIYRCTKQAWIQNSQTSLPFYYIYI